MTAKRTQPARTHEKPATRLRHLISPSPLQFEAQSIIAARIVPLIGRLEIPGTSQLQLRGYRRFDRKSLRLLQAVSPLFEKP
ncbi:hypothetical protein PF003_g33309 [Phytophthora fragariae]|nr:hypothetical protein PF003_g33309 [Phytophthora fragariae]